MAWNTSQNKGHETNKAQIYCLLNNISPTMELNDASLWNVSHLTEHEHVKWSDVEALYILYFVAW